MALVHPIAILTILNNQYFKSNRNIAPSQKALRRIKLTRLIKCTHVTHTAHSRVNEASISLNSSSYLSIAWLRRVYF